MTYLCSTAIPDQAVLAILGFIAASGGASLKFLWRRVNQLQTQVAKLTVQIEIYRNCPARECPAHHMAERVRLDELQEGAA